MSSISFTDAVAQRTGRAVEEVTRVLAAARVPTTDSVGAPHRLRVTRLTFSGRKSGIFTDDIYFDREFGDGLWALASAKNDRGKTSVLEIIMWCLRGLPKRLQDDVHSWIQAVSLEATVDDERFVVSFSLTDGAPKGTLTCGTDTWPFASEAAFADTMSEFLMERLGFHALPQWVDRHGLTTHGWPLYSTVLYLPREAEGAVIGDVVGAGLAQRLVLLFVGVRWARTLVACQAARGEARAEATERQAENRTLQRVANGAIGANAAELVGLRARINALPEDLPTDQQIAAARAEWMGLITRHGEVASDLADAQRDARAAQSQAARERKRLTDLTEAALARRLFHGLDPAACPRCSTAIGQDRKSAETTDHTCAVCSRVLDLGVDPGIDDAPIGADEADEPASANDREQLVADLESAAAMQRARADALASDASKLADELSTAKELLQVYASQAVQVEERRTLEVRSAALETVIRELENLATDSGPPTPSDGGAVERLQILDAAATEAKARVDEGFAEVTDLVNAAILELAHRFGFETLEAARLNLAAQLHLVKGGIDTSFSKQTPGEKLRLRIAVIVALLRVAHQLGIGRHPGLLLIDSIGAEETEPGDLAEFMRELQLVTAEIGIETIVASARPEILAHIAKDRQVAVGGDEYLW